MLGTMLGAGPCSACSEGVLVFWITVVSLGGRTALGHTESSIHLLELKNDPDLSWTTLTLYRQGQGDLMAPGPGTSFKV